MGLLDRLVGKRLSDHEDEGRKLGALAGVPVLGLDALGSAAYGPEAALTILLPLGAAAPRLAAPLLAGVVALLGVVYLSYRQAVSAYPDGGGSYTVARANLGKTLGLAAAVALALDYVLNVAVGIAAGVGTLVSAVPALLPHSLALCLGVLVLLTLANLRGVRESSAVVMLPTCAFVATLGLVVAVGVARAFAAGGHPRPLAAPPALPAATQAATAWLLVRAFASGCAALTGVEAVSNAVPIFRRPSTLTARRSLAAIVAILAVLLAGIAYLCAAYGVGATPPGRPGYESVLSSVVSAVFGRGAFYGVTMASIVAVLALSANTSFADFPQLCRALAGDRYLPAVFATRGRRLVLTSGVVALAGLSGALLVAFGGVTDRLVPLFAIGALLAFTLSQAGMARHWRRRLGRPNARLAVLLNMTGALATGAVVLVLVATRLADGAWVAVLGVPLAVTALRRVNAYYRRVGAQVGTIAPLELPALEAPIVVLAAGGWSKLMQQGLKFALRLSPEVYVVQVKTETDATEDLADNWDLLIASRARAAGLTQPRLVTLTSDTREFGRPFVAFVNQLEAAHPTRDIAVVIPDLVLRRWYEALLHNHRAAALRRRLRAGCSSRVVIIHTGFKLEREAPPS
jgi:amino acid transporter